MRDVRSNSLQKPEVYVIGNLSDDYKISTPFSVVMGGPPAYIGIQLALLGYPTSVITKLPEDHNYIKELESLGVTVINLPIRDPDKRGLVTSFINEYGCSGRRSQMVKNIQEEITGKDLENIMLPENARVIMAPLFDEITADVYQRLGKDRELIIAPQGHFRYIKDPAGSDFSEVLRRFWLDYQVVRKEDVVILSEEDLLFSQGNFMLRALRTKSNLVIVTRGREGASVFSDLENLNVPAFHLHPFEEKEFTGAGDIFTAGIAVFLDRDNIEASVRKANWLAAAKIFKSSQEGARGVSNAEDLSIFMAFHPEYWRYLNYRELGIEGSGYHTERLN